MEVEWYGKEAEVDGNFEIIYKNENYNKYIENYKNTLKWLSDAIYSKRSIIINTHRRGCRHHHEFLPKKRRVIKDLRPKRRVLSSSEEETETGRGKGENTKRGGAGQAWIEHLLG